jgi:hypothetical protein
VQCDKAGDAVLKSSFTLSVNGLAKEVSAPKGVLRETTPRPHDGRVLALTSTVDGKRFLIVVFNWDFQNPPVGGIITKTYYSTDPETWSSSGPGMAKSECRIGTMGSDTQCDGMAVSYDEGMTRYRSDYYIGNYESTVTITACDTGKKIISGEYDVMVIDVTGVELLLKGEFTNVKYD